EGMGHDAGSTEVIRGRSNGRGHLTGLVVEQDDAAPATGLQDVDADHLSVEGRNLRIGRRGTGIRSRLQNRQEGDEQWVLRMADLDAKGGSIGAEGDATRDR